MADRGEIYNRNRAGQLINFGGLVFGKITPTDVDGFIDFGDRAFVWLEYKAGDADMPYGQRLALQRTAAAARQTGRGALVLVCEHSTPIGQDIDGAAARVREYWYEGQWQHTHAEITTRAVIERFRKKYFSD